MRASAELASLAALLARIADLPGGRVRASAGRASWARWLDLVEENQLAPLIASRLLLRDGARDGMAAPASGPFPESVASVLLDRYVRSGHEAAFRTSELLRVLDLFEETSRPVLLKGAALAHSLYGESAERPMSDLDLLLPSEAALLRSRHLLAGEGYRPDPVALREVPIGHHHAPPLRGAVSELTIELHLNLATPPLPQGAMVDLWRRRRGVHVAGHGRVYVLDPVSQLIHHALHAVADPVESPLLRNLFEVACLAARLDAADRSTVRALALRWGIEGRAGAALQLAAELFGTPVILSRGGRLDARVRWARARLEWSDSAARGRWAKLRRHLAIEHLARLDRGASPGSPGPLFAVLLDTAKAALGSRGEALLRRLRLARGVALALEAIDLPVAEIAGRILAHDPATGAVHLLDAVASEAWREARRGTDPRSLEVALEGRGVPTIAARSSLVRLSGAGLLKLRA